jgi:hypothetical protein
MPVPFKRFLIVAAMLVAPIACANGQDATAAPMASLAGVVRDSTGAPIPAVEIVVTGTTRATRSDSSGAFRLEGMAPGAHRIWFRRLGYSSAQFDWAALAGQRTEIVVVMMPIARTLDPVVVRAQEDRDLAANASILGLVVDTAGVPVDEAEVQLVGANRSGLTRANGGFLFRPLPVGPYVVRIRKLGYQPATLKLNLVAGDDREVIVRMKRLPAQMSPVIVTERSGYDPRDQLVYDDLERRMRLKSMRNPVLGPEDLRRFYGLDLQIAMKGLLLERPLARLAPSPSRPAPEPKSRMERRLEELDTPVCILLNGKRPLYQPLRTFTTDDIDLLEIYPGGTEVTGTVGARMGRRECLALSIIDHPTYYVLWLKGAR